MPQLSIVIATYNRAKYLPRTLISLTKQTLNTDKFEVVVVNNNSTDNTVEAFEFFAKEHPGHNFKMLFEAKQGLSHARNCGIKGSSGDLIAIIDDDEEVNPEFAQSYLDLFENYPDVAAAGGKVVPLYEFKVPNWLTSYAERPIAGTLDLGEKIIPFTKGYPGGGNMGVRRSVIERYGAFDPSLGRTGKSLLGGEEKDFFERLKRGGEQIYYLPGAIIYHIIDEAKLNREYFTRLARMVGFSERVRTRNEGTASFIKRLLSEAVKWMATLVLFAGYTLRTTPIKGWYLILLRWNITLGLLGYKTT